MKPPFTGSAGLSWTHGQQGKDEGDSCEVPPPPPHSFPFLMREILTQVLQKQLGLILCSVGASLVVQRVKNLSAMGETCVQTLGQEDPLEKGKATHSGILARGIPWTAEPAGLKSFRMTQATQQQQHLQ